MTALTVILLIAVAALLGVVIAMLSALLRRRPEAGALPVREALAETERRLGDRLEAIRRSGEASDARQRQELGSALGISSEALQARVTDLKTAAGEGIDQVRRLVSETMPERLEKTVARRFEDDFGKVRTVLDEVRKQLLQVERLGVGVRSLSDSVHDFSRMLGNVKSRGTWAEWQLGSILGDMMAPGQFARNVHPNPRSARRVVEYAIALPGGDDRPCVWLPIDSKFPREDYDRLLQAVDSGDRAAEEKAAKDLADRVKGFARDVRDAYILPPYTTDFAILYLPTEGLYQEVLRQGGTVDEIQRAQKVLLAGPTTLAALINALQMGFQTLAVQRNTVRVMDTLKRVKEALEKFEKQNASTLKALHSAVSNAEKDGERLKVLQRALKDVVLDPGTAGAEAEAESEEEEKGEESHA